MNRERSHVPNEETNRKDAPPQRPLPRSTEEYRAMLAALPDLLASTLSHPLETGVIDRLASARRIIFTGCGSSWPVAFASAELFSKYGYPAWSEYTSQILEKGVWTPRDVVILISQGWNRSDACRVTDKVLSSSPATLVVVTGRSEHRESHLARASSEDSNNRLFTLSIDPNKEKLFCRPASPVTSFAKVVHVFQELTGQSGLLASVRKAVDMTMHQKISVPAWEVIPQKVVIMGSGALYGAAQGIALMLREGAGIESEAYECEAYGHGLYVPHQYQCQIDPGSIKFVLISGVDSQDGATRLIPLLRDTGMRYEEWGSHEKLTGAFVQHLITGSTLVRMLNERTFFDMNTPPGMEENRAFHEEGGL